MNADGTTAERFRGKEVRSLGQRRFGDFHRIKEGSAVMARTLFLCLNAPYHEITSGPSSVT